MAHSYEVINIVKEHISFSTPPPSTPLSRKPMKINRTLKCARIMLRIVQACIRLQVLKLNNNTAYLETNMSTLSFKKTAVAGLATALCSVSLGALAHTTIQNSITATGGATSTSYNNLVIGHGCTDGKGKKWPVIAQSVVFPTVNPVITDDTNETVPSDNGAVMSDVITATNGLAGIPQLIQNKDIFKFQSEKTTGTNVIGFNGYGGKLDTTLHGLVPFRMGGITIKDTSSDSNFNSTCIKTLNIRVGVADICKMKFPPKEGTANLWLPNFTTKFPAALDGNGSGGTRDGAPAKIAIDNSDACPSGITVSIWPSDEDIDANLIIPKKWGR
jgi:hypothetical protein